MTGFLLSLHFIFAASAAAQVGMPGVSYNGGKTEKDICTRKSNPPAACASLMTRFSDAKIIFDEKSHFWLNCSSYYRQIAAEKKKIDALERDCNEYVEAGTTVIATHSNGAGVEGIEDAKKIAVAGAARLRSCAAELAKFPPLLEKMEAQIDARLETAETAEDRLKAKLASETPSDCKGSDIIPVFWDLQDIISRYKQGLKARIGEASNDAEEAVKDYNAAAENLDGFVRQNTQRVRKQRSVP